MGAWGPASWPGSGCSQGAFQLQASSSTFCLTAKDSGQRNSHEQGRSAAPPAHEPLPRRRLRRRPLQRALHAPPQRAAPACGRRRPHAPAAPPHAPPPQRWCSRGGAAEAGMRGLGWMLSVGEVVGRRFCSPHTNVIPCAAHPIFQPDHQATLPALTAAPLPWPASQPSAAAGPQGLSLSGARCLRRRAPAAAGSPLHSAPRWRRHPTCCD